MRELFSGLLTGMLLTLIPCRLAAMGEPAAACDLAAQQAAVEFGVPEAVMLAIARVESGHGKGSAPWPWTVNHAGDGQWFETLADASSYVDAQIAAGESNLDIGCFQLNLHWHGKNFPSVATMFDPLENARYAAQFLDRLYGQEGNWVDAVAAYHSQTPDHAAAYIEKVESVLLAMEENHPRDSMHAGNAAEPAESARAQNRFPLLQPGGEGAFGSLVALNTTAMPLIGAP